MRKINTVLLNSTIYRDYKRACEYLKEAYIAYDFYSITNPKKSEARKNVEIYEDRVQNLKSELLDRAVAEVKVYRDFAVTNEYYEVVGSETHTMRLDVIVGYNKDDIQLYSDGSHFYTYEDVLELGWKFKVYNGNIVLSNLY